MKKILISMSILAIIFAVACAKDDKTIRCTSIPTITLGNDTTVISNTSIKLNAITDADSGKWTVISGENGRFEEPALTNSQFTGTINSNYLLRWVSYNACGNNADTLMVTFKSEVNPADMVNNMHWLGQSDYRIETAGKVIYIDHTRTTADKPADLVLITHSHGDHFSAAAIAKVATANTVVVGPADCKYTGVCKEFITIVPGEEYMLNDFVKIKAVPAYNVVKVNNHPKAKKWVGYLVISEGVTIYHAGDTERIPEMKEFTCDISLLPLGQTYTMASVDEAVEATKDVQPEIAIPMHYGTGEGKVSDAADYKAKLDGIIEVIIKIKE